MEFDKTILTRSFARKHSGKNYGFCRTLKEAFADAKELNLSMKEELSTERAFGKAVKSCLGANEQAREQNAESLLLYIKARTPVLKFWSSLLSAFTGLFGFTSAGIALMFAAFGIKVYWLAAVLLVSTACLAVFKYVFDKRTFWYEYLAAHIDYLVKHKGLGGDA